MRTPILFLALVLLLFCCGNPTKNQAQVDSTHKGEFILSIDTLNINIKPYVSADKVSLTHAVKFGESYYCYFTDKKDSYSKYFFQISNKGSI